MTDSKDQSDKYIKMMWAQISISISILLSMIAVLMTVSGSVGSLMKDLETLNNWTKEVHKWEIVPNTERSLYNTKQFNSVFNRLHQNDSINSMQNNHIKRLFQYTRIDRDGIKAFND